MLEPLPPHKIADQYNIITFAVSAAGSVYSNLLLTFHNDCC